MGTIEGQRCRVEKARPERQGAVARRHGFALDFTTEELGGVPWRAAAWREMPRMNHLALLEAIPLRSDDLEDAHRTHGHLYIDII